MVNTLLGQDGVDVAALFKAIEGEIRVSLRSNGRLNVQAAAQRLGGGGHFRASGLTFADRWTTRLRGRRGAGRRRSVIDWVRQPL